MDRRERCPRTVASPRNTIEGRPRHRDRRKRLVQHPEDVLRVAIHAPIDGPSVANPRRPLTRTAVQYPSSTEVAIAPGTVANPSDAAVMAPSRPLVAKFRYPRCWTLVPSARTCAPPQIAIDAPADGTAANTHTDAAPTVSKNPRWLSDQFPARATARPVAAPAFPMLLPTETAMSAGTHHTHLYQGQPNSPERSFLLMGSVGYP